MANMTFIENIWLNSVIFTWGFHDIMRSTEVGMNHADGVCNLLGRPNKDTNLLYTMMTVLENKKPGTKYPPSYASVKSQPF